MPKSVEVRRPLAIAAVVIASVSACSGSEQTVSTTVAPPASATQPTTATTAVPPTTPPTTTTTTTTLPPLIRQPLSGEVVEQRSEIPKRPALVVKIDNASGARRNHTGLGVADIVFEEIVEGSITRFAAVFHSRGSDPVGPIRSGRSQDVDMLTALRHPLFAWSGGNPGVTRLIAESPLTDLNWQKHGGTYYRGDGSIPHNLYSSTERLWALTPADWQGAPPAQFEFLRPEQSFDGTPIVQAAVPMRGIDVVWDWDGVEGKWRRSQEGSPHVDQQTGPIMATNVVMMVVEYVPSRIDTRSPEAQTVSNGPAYVMVDGELVEGRWRRTSRERPLELVRIDGVPIRLQPGNTWIELVEARASGAPAFPLDDVVITPAG